MQFASPLEAFASFVEYRLIRFQQESLGKSRGTQIEPNHLPLLFVASLIGCLRAGDLITTLRRLWTMALFQCHWIL